MKPVLLITRPQPGADRFASQIMTAGLDVDIMISPLQVIESVAPHVPSRDYRGLVLTSENAALRVPEQFRHLPAWCVGPRTAKAASEAGLVTHVAGGDASTLVAKIVAEAQGPLLFLHGVHTVGDVAGKLNAAGIETDATVNYRQRDVEPTAIALDVLRSSRTVVLPLFSPRSARLAAEVCKDAIAPLVTVAISEAADAAWTGPEPQTRVVAAKPSAEAMEAAIRSQMHRDDL